ncbi:hypothetical protein LCL97_21720 [Seohaeicola saemankumensis]|nr:hypothetical protein [Seohaeicola saemankumensis]MCA0873458.1 hypothetical protein [Seohaeicola saemankumensis]
MTVVIAHGQPKSGSTFLYMTALEVVQIVNREEFYTFKDRVLGANTPTFVDKLTAETILEIDEKLAPGQTFVLKTHADLEDEVADLITAGRVKAFTSFRDPRDTALSTLNVGEKDRAKGETRWFAKITEIGQLTNPIQFQWAETRDWVRHPDVLAVPYYVTAMSQSTSVKLLTEFLGMGYLSNTLAADMDAKREKLPEYNKGVLDRFVNELSVEDLKFANDTWADTIAEYNALLEETMTRLGHRMAYTYYTRMRDAKIAERVAAA